MVRLMKSVLKHLQSSFPQNNQYGNYDFSRVVLHLFTSSMGKPVIFLDVRWNLVQKGGKHPSIGHKKIGEGEL